MGYPGYDCKHTWRGIPILRNVRALAKWPMIGVRRYVYHTSRTWAEHKPRRRWGVGQ